jgi:hypothetical protein
MLKDSKEWLGLNFIWFFGVVEDIIDPLNIGRVKIRCYGWHTDDREVLPPEELPWAQVMMPNTSASMAGVGESPTGLIEGSHVIGFFMDGESAQQPMIIGSFHGIPAPPNLAKGFTDPTGGNHTQFNLPDTPNLAYDRWASDKISREKEKNRVTKVPTAVRSKLETADDVSGVSYNTLKGTDANKEELNTWNEPIQRGESISIFPDNHVKQTKGGHAFEVDDTPDGERIHEYHKSGTFYEVLPNGTKVTKIVGDDYEILAQGKNVLVKGEVNITVKGNARVLYEKNLIQEVGGDYHLTVHGNRYTKIVNNDSIDILGNRTTQINQEELERITKNKIKIIGGDENQNIKGNESINIIKNKQENVFGDRDNFTNGVDTEICISNKVIGCAANVNISADENIKFTATIDSDMIAGDDVNITASDVTTIVGTTKIDLNP